MEAGEQKFKICKVCKAAIKNGTKKLPVVDTPAQTKTETAQAAPEASSQEAVAETPAAAEAPAAETAAEPEAKEE
jgi:hypothetical protein